MVALFPPTCTSVTGLLAAIAAAQEGAIYLDPRMARQVVEHLKPSFSLSTKDTPDFPNPHKTTHNSPTSNVDRLSGREMEVLKLMVEGQSNSEIAANLYLSPSTVKTHIRGIMNKFAVNDRVQAAVVALRSGLL